MGIDQQQADHMDVASVGHMSDLMTEIDLIRQVKTLRLKNQMRTKRTESLDKNLVGGIIGNALEWFDFAIFGFFAPVIGDLFFPSDEPLVSLLGAFGVFAIAGFVRPLGGIMFGRIGDRFGRKRALQLSVMMMAVPTFLIGLLPTHAQAGALAPVLLIVFALCKDFQWAGEMIGSIAFVAETVKIEKRGYFSSWSFASCYIGMMLGSLVAVWLNGLLGPAAVSSWGWRLPFLAGLGIGAAGLWMRRELRETPVFEEIRTEGSTCHQPLTEAVRQVPWRMFHASILVALCGCRVRHAFYLVAHAPQPLRRNACPSRHGAKYIFIASPRLPDSHNGTYF